MRATLLSLAVLVACVGGEAKIVKNRYPRADEVRPHTGYTVAGLKLFVVQMPSVPDRSGARFVVGVDGGGRLVEGADLFRRASAGLAPADVVRRAFDTLLGSAGGAGLDPAADERSSIYPEEEWALVAAPAESDGVITFWLARGEMRPELTRAQLTVATGDLSLHSARDILHPPEAAIPGIREQLHATDPTVVKRGLQAVSEWKELAPDVEALLSHDEPTVRWMAADVLGNLKLPRSVGPLIGLLERGPEWADRSRAAQVLLFRLGAPEGVAAVRARLARATDTSEVVVLRDLLADFDAGKRR